MPCLFVKYPPVYPGGGEPGHQYPLSGTARALGGEARPDARMLEARLAVAAVRDRAAAQPPPSRLRLPAALSRTLSPRQAASLTRSEELQLSPPRQLVELTRYPRRVTSADPDELRNAVDVSELDQLDLLLSVLAFESGTANVTIAVETAMQNESDDAWVTLDTFTAVTSAPSYELITFTSLMRYVRFRVASISTAPATFTLAGMGRRQGRM